MYLPLTHTHIHTPVTGVIFNSSGFEEFSILKTIRKVAGNVQNYFGLQVLRRLR